MIGSSLILLTCAVLAAAAATGTFEKRQQILSCSTQAESVIKTAIYNALTTSGKAGALVQNNQHGTALETKWFGKFDGGRHNEILSVFEVLDFPSWTYVCKECSESDPVAFANPSVDDVINLCPAFWKSIGDSARVEVLIREATRFPEILRGKDYAVGRKACLALAKKHPGKAIENAASYGLFAIEA